MGFKALENNADDPAGFFALEPQSKRYREIFPHADRV